MIARRRRVLLGGAAVTVLIIGGTTAATVARAPIRLAQPAPTSDSFLWPSPFSTHDQFGSRRVSVPTPVPLRLGPTTRPVVDVVVLLYHFVRVVTAPNDRLGKALSVTPTDLEAQLTLLKERHVHSLSPDEFRQVLETGRQPEGPVVLITFDDGFADFATTAAPLLHRYGFTAIDYVISGNLGQPNYMTVDQLNEVEGLGMHIGAHTVHHVPLAAADPARLAAEINGSKTQLETLLGHPVIDFAYPFGSYSPAAVAAVQAAGFRTAVTTDYGSQQAVARPFTLRRIRVLGGETLAQFGASAGLPVS